MYPVSRSSGHFSSYDGTPIYYEDRGKGEPIVFAYGIGCLINHWNPQIKYFSKNYRTVVFDYRAHNKSGTPEDPSEYTLESLAKDIEKLLETLNIPQAHFVGHSFGAQVLTKTYDLNPDLFKSLTFINGFVTNPIRGMFGSEVPTKIFETVKMGLETLPSFMSKAWKATVNSPLSVPVTALAGGFNLSLTNYKDIEIYVKALSQMELKWFVELFEQMMEYDGTPVLPRIRVPSLIIGGKKDSVTPAKHQYQMHELIQGSQITLMPYGTHCTQLDLGEYVNLRLEKFLKEVSASPKDAAID